MILNLHGLYVFLIWSPKHVDYDGELVTGVLPLQERCEEAELPHHTPEAPHVDGRGVLCAPQQELGGAVEPAADVGSEVSAGSGLGEDVTGAAEVTDLDEFSAGLVENVARLEVSMSNVETVQVLKTSCYLVREECHL